MSIFKSSKIVNSKFNVKKSTGPDVFNVVDNSKNVSIVGKQLDGDVITFTGNAADYAISASVNNVAIRFVNDAGKFVTVKFSILEARSVTLAFADGGFEIDNLPGKGKIAIDGALVGKKYLSVENYLDLDGLGDDRGALLDPALATSALDSINTNPVFTSANTITVTEDVSFSGQLAATDADGHPLTYSLVSNQGDSEVDGIAVVNSNGSFTYTPVLNFNGTDSFVVQVNDGKGGVVQQTITVTVNPVNDAPVATADTVAVTEDATLVAGTVATNDSDVDGDTLTYALAPTQAPVPGLTFNSNGSFLFDPKNAAYQSIADGIVLPVVVSYIVTDGKLTTSATLTLNIIGTNDAPVFTSATTATVLEDNVLAGQLLATDVDEDELVFTLDADAAHGSVVVGEDGAYTYTPDAGFSGSDSFTVAVFDGVTTVKQTVTVTVAEGDIVYSLTDGVDVLTGLGVRNIFQETVEGQFGQDDIIAGGQFDTTAEDMVDDELVARASEDTLLLRSDTVTDVQFSNTTGIERLVMNSANGTGNDTVTLGEKASAAGIVSLETRGGDDRVDVSAVTDEISVDAGVGSDTLVLSGELADVTLDLDENTIDVDLITLAGFENVDASALESGALIVTANAAGSTILGSNQDDTITGGAGVDVIRGNLGADAINTGGGANIVVFVGSLDAAANALYADFDGTVVAGDQTLNLAGVVSREELTQLKAESDVAEGESLLSNPDDLIVIFGDVDLSGLDAFPFPNTFVVNSTLTLRFDQIANDTRIVGGLIDGEQTPSELIITNIPSNVVLELDALSLSGIEKLVLDIDRFDDLPATFPEGFFGEIYVIDEMGDELLVSEARELVEQMGELVRELRELNANAEDYIKDADIVETAAQSITVINGIVTADQEPLGNADILVLTREPSDFEPQFVDLRDAFQPIVVRGNDFDQTVRVDLSDFENDNIVLDLAGGIDTVEFDDSNVFYDGQYQVRFVSSQVGDGTDSDVTIFDNEFGTSLTVNDEGTLLVPSSDLEPSAVNPFNVRGINVDGSLAEGQNRGDFRYVALGTSGSDDFEADDFGDLQDVGNVYINAGGGDDYLAADAVAGQRHFLVGGTGNDDIVVSADESSEVVVLAGSGGDIVVLQQSSFFDSQDGHVFKPYAGSYKLNGGAGRDVLQISASLDADLAADIVGFEVLAFDVDYEGASDLTLDLQIFESQNTIDTIRVEDIENGDVTLNNVSDAVTTLELVNGGDLEAAFTINRLNDTESNSITIKTSPAYQEESFTYDVEDDLYLDDEEFITIDTGSKVANGFVNDDGTEEFNTSDLDIEALYAEDLQTLTIVGDGDVDIENLYLGDTVRVVKIDASAATGRVNVDASDNEEGASINYIGSSGENDVEGTDSDDVITVVSDADENDIEGNGGDDVISFTGNGLDNFVDGEDGDDTITVHAMFNEALDNIGTINSFPSDFRYQVDILGGDGDDSITVTGTAAVDIEGGAGDDTIISGSGDDLITGGTGADTLTGGEGKDTFVYFAGQSDPVSDGFDTITDFDVEDDIFSFLEFGEFEFTTINILDKANSTTDFATEAALLTGLAGFDTSNANIGQDAVLFVIGDDGYLFVDSNNNDLYDVSSEFGNDVLIKLVGVTDVSDINFVGSKPLQPEIITVA